MTREIFFFKNCAEKEAAETRSRPLFIFLKKPNMRLKEEVRSLVSVYFDRPQLGMH